MPNWPSRSISRLVVVGLAMALALALPGSTEASTFNELQKLIASDAQIHDAFGHSVAISGDTAVVGANAGGRHVDVVYIFGRSQGGTDNWGEVRKLTASDAQADDEFGVSVAVSGDTTVIGASGHEAAVGDRTGAAYIFRRDEGGSGNWGEVKKLIASDAQANDRFGSSVAISGDSVIVGASREDAGGLSAGAAYVFKRDDGGSDNWGEVKKITASDAQAGDVFGVSVVINGDTAIVGAALEDAGGNNAGAAYVFQRSQGGADNWGEVKKLTATNAQDDDEFGISVAVSGDTAIVGAWLEDAGGSQAGAAYVFGRDEGGSDNWGEVTKLTASDAQANDLFGSSVAVSDDISIVGAFDEDAGGTGAGAAYVFQRDEGGVGNWGEVKKLTASDAQAGDTFGWSVALGGDTAVVGAALEDAWADATGAAYVFDLQQPKATVTPTPTITPTPPPAVGGISLDSDLRPLQLEATDRDSPPWGVAVGVAVASLLAGGGAAWYARARKPTEN